MSSEMVIAGGRFIVVLSILALAAGIAHAGLDEGKAAFERADYPVAFRELQPLAEQGNAYAQSRLGFMYFGGLSVARNPEEALKWLRKAVDQGDAYAQGWLGLMYVEGVGVARDVAEGLRWIRMAADRGAPFAQNMLGLTYRHGQGVAKDEAEALKWIGKAAEGFRKAADQGDASAQYMLAGMHANGQGVAKDDAEAVKWLRKAAEQGHATAQFSVGIAYRTGRGVARDVAEGVTWIRKAADQGNVDAQASLGLMYEEANGVVKDDAEALKWYRKAADQGNAGARNRVIALQKKLEAAKRDPSAATTPDPPQWQQQMDKARRNAAAGYEQAIVLTFPGSQSGKSGVYVFYNSPRPHCYTYVIPGEWVRSPKEGPYRSKDGRAFAGVTFLPPGNLDGVEGATKLERARNVAIRQHEKFLRQPVVGAELVPFESARPGTWQLKAAPITYPNGRTIPFPLHIIVDLSPHHYAEINVIGTGDDENLARRIIETLRTTTDPECYLPVLESMYKALGER